MQTILVTGASGGIGKAIVESLRSAGARVVEVSHHDADLSSPEEVGGLQKKLAGEALDWIVCAHGYLGDFDGKKESGEDVEKTFAINTFSLIHVVRQFSPQVSRGFVFISSNAGVHPNPLLPVYSASKAAVNALSQALARGNSGKSFISICPGPTDTAMYRKISPSGGGQEPSEVAQLVLAAIDTSGHYKNGDVITLRSGDIRMASRIDS